MIDRFLGRILRRPLLLDAAMGTRLIAQGLDLASDDPCLWNLTHPEAVLDLHRRDVATGAEAVFTNTFGANRSWLARYGRDQDTASINRRAVDLARAAVGADLFVIGSIGPTATDKAVIREQADLLLGAGADALVLETFRLDQAIQVLGWLKDQPRPLLVGLFDWPDPLESTAQRLLDAGATVVGANCFTDLSFAGRFLAMLAKQGDRIGWLKPSAGVPGGPTLSTSDFAALAGRIAQLKVGLLGGCCGTSEGHLGAIRATWNQAGIGEQAAGQACAQVLA